MEEDCEYAQSIMGHKSPISIKLVANKNAHPKVKQNYCGYSTVQYPLHDPGRSYLDSI